MTEAKIYFVTWCNKYHFINFKKNILSLAIYKSEIKTMKSHF